MKRYLASALFLLAACAPGTQQTELEPVPPMRDTTAPRPVAEPPAAAVSPAEPGAAALPDVPATGAEAAPADPAAPAGGEAAAPSPAPQGSISISADEQNFVTSSAGELNPVTVSAGSTFYLQLNFTDPDGVTAAQIELRNSPDTGTLPRGPFTIASSDCEAAVASAPTDLTCTVAVTVAPDAQNISQAGETAYAFRPRVTDALGNSELSFSWAYLIVEPL